MGGWRGPASKAGISVSEASALYSSAHFACLRAISESFAILPRGIYQRGENESRKTVSGHASARMLKVEANPMLSAYRFWELTQRHCISSGNGYAEIQLDKQGNAVGLWPLPPNRVEPVPVVRKGVLDVVYDIKLNE